MLGVNSSSPDQLCVFCINESAFKTKIGSPQFQSFSSSYLFLFINFQERSTLNIVCIRTLLMLKRSLCSASQ